MLRPGKKFHNRPSLMAAVTLLLLALLTVSTGFALTTSEEKTELGSIERRVRSVCETVGPAVVRLEWKTDHEAGACSGVIVTADGYVVTTSRPPLAIHHGGSVALYVAGGRRVTATALGWSEEWKIGLVKITEKGPWPHVKLGKQADSKAGQLCVALGYRRLIGNQFERRPALRLGCVTKSAAPVWLTSSCVGADFGSSVFDLEGRLVGVTTALWSGEDAVHTGTELIKRHWDELVAGKNLDRVRLFSSELATGNSQRTDGSESQFSAEEDPVSAAIEKAKQATVRIRRTSDGHEEGWSGVIVSSDGYVTTCAHGWHLPGEKVTISLSDGRDVAGKVLGTNWVSDICLVKITEEGPWPHAELGNSAMMRPDDPCLVIGYPVSHRDRQPLVRRLQIIEPQDYPVSPTLFTSSSGRTYRGEDTGVSGGGVFDLEGRVVAVLQGIKYNGVGKNGRVELFRKQWNFLAAGRLLDVITSEPLGHITAAFGRVANDLPPMVVEVLGDKKQRALGTIVRSDGRILTKASELYGTLSCRFADGRILPATVEKESREHDLAVLKVDASHLPEADWSQSERISAGTLVAALTAGNPPLVGVVSQLARPIRPEPGHLGVGVRDSDRGLEVHEDEWARQFDIPIRKGDIIVHVEGHQTPDRKTFLKLTEPEPGHAGDPIRVGVKRVDETLEFRFPLAPDWSPYPEYQSRRCSAFPRVFDTDLPLTLKMCGGPVIDKTGRVAGITIASRGNYGASRARIHVIPATVASKVANKLMNMVSE